MITRNITLENELCDLTDSAVSRLYFVQNQVVRKCKGWEPSFENETIEVVSIIGKWPTIMLLCNGHPKRNFPTNGNYPRFSDIHCFYI